MGRAVKLDVVQGFLVGLQDPVDSIAFRVENVAVEGETVRIILSDPQI